MSYATAQKKRYETFAEWQEQRKYLHVVLTPEEQEIKRKCELSLHFFIKTFWHVVEGEHKFFDNWHIRDISLHLQATLEGKIRYLVINIPFRCMKSLICNVFFPAFAWIKHSHKKVFCLTGDKDLSMRDSIKCKRIIESDLYQKFWGTNFKLRKDVNTNSRFANTKGGERLIKSIGGNAVGHGGDINIFDDINRADDIIYKTLRDRTRARLYSIFVRQDSTTTSVTILIMQRLHEEDAAQLLLDMKLPGTYHLMLPMEFDPDRKCETIALGDSDKKWCDPRSKKNELLWPSRMPRSYVDELKIMLGTEYNRSSQLQQLPTAESGNIFKSDWFNIWTENKAPDCLCIIESWDTAISTQIDSCNSAMVSFGVFQTLDNKFNLILLGAWTGKLEQPDLRRMIIRLGRNYHSINPQLRSHSIEMRDPELSKAASMILIEDTLQGKGIIQDLNRSGLPVFGFNPNVRGLSGGSDESGKTRRARLASITVEQGLVWLPANEHGILFPFADRVMKALLGCPTSKDQDLVDAVSQALIEIRARELVYLPTEEPPIKEHKWREDPSLVNYLSPNLTYSDLGY
jgi:hypothetical protein